MRRFGLAMMVGISVAVGGCAVGPNYRAPKTAVEGSYGAGGNGVTESPMVAARWWETLEDPLLDRLIDDTVAANLDVKIAEARLRQARGELAAATGGRYPTVNADGSYAHTRLSQTAAPYNAFNVPGFPWEYNQYQVGFDASWELDVFGGIQRKVEAAKADVEASAAQRQDVLLSAMAEMARNYVDLRGYQRREEIARKNLASQRETLEVTRDRRKQGVVTELDVAQAQSQVARTEAALPLLERSQAEAIHRMATLTGREPEALTEELAAPRRVPVPPPEIAIGVPAELLRRRPDIREAERAVAAATARIGQATADLYPKFSLTGDFSMLSADASRVFDWRSRSLGVGPTVTWAIFDAGRLRSVVKVRSAEQAEALARYERTVLGAEEEVHNALVTFATEQRRHRALADAVAADETGADVAMGQYRQGVTDFLHVLEAQRSLFDSQDQLADSDRLVTTSLIALYKALGGGWESGDAAANSPAAVPATRPKP